MSTRPSDVVSEGVARAATTIAHRPRQASPALFISKRFDDVSRSSSAKQDIAHKNGTQFANRSIQIRNKISWGKIIEKILTRVIDRSRDHVSE